VGAQYVSIVAQHKPQLNWDEASQEHYLEYAKEEAKQQRHRVYYPSLKSLDVRLKEAEKWGVGISIWEIGQGLDYFFDLL
jgi:chitinase domain-containing protein 1